VAPGRYQLGAYEDRNQNRHLDPGERMRPPSAGAPHSVGPGEVAREDLVLAQGATTPPELTESTDIRGLVARTPREQQEFSLWAWSVQGEICDDLRDARFGQASADRGLWRIMDFLNEGLAGIYFLAPYDAKRVPVLFVHGIAGTPQQFLPLIASLDTERFQPWFYFYPSGFSLDRIADHLSTLLKRLQVEHGFDELAIVAHSAGGLVSRAAILDYERETEREDVRLFLTIATPWGGQARAARAAGARVEMPRSFQDMSPSSDFLRRLFYEDEAQRNARRLGSSVEFHMLFGFRMRSRRGTRTMESSRWQPDASGPGAGEDVRLDAGHVEIQDARRCAGDAAAHELDGRARSGRRRAVHPGQAKRGEPQAAEFTQPGSAQRAAGERVHSGAERLAQLLVRERFAAAASSGEPRSRIAPSKWRSDQHARLAQPAAWPAVAKRVELRSEHEKGGSRQARPTTVTPKFARCPACASSICGTLRAVAAAEARDRSVPARDHRRHQQHLVDSGPPRARRARPPRQGSRPRCRRDGNSGRVAAQLGGLRGDDAARRLSFTAAGTGSPARADTTETTTAPTSAASQYRPRSADRP
jgi:hypothetical protein